MLEGFEPTTVDVFGSLCTQIPRNDMAEGLSPDCTNVVFVPGGVGSRPGLTPRAYQDGSSTAFVSVCEYIRPDGVPNRILLDSSGTMFRESFASLVTIQTNVGTGMYFRACQFGTRLYLALSDGKTPKAPARAYEYASGERFDPFGIAETASSCTPQDAGVMTDFTSGWRNFIVVLETRGGYLGAPGMPSPFNTTAGHGFSVTNLTKDTFSPTYVTRRRIYCTLAAPSQAAIVNVYYTHPYLWANDPSTTTTISPPKMTDAMLVGYAESDPSGSIVWGGLRPLPQCVGLASYSNRLVAWGVQHSIPRLVPAYQEGLWGGGFAGGINGGSDPTMTTNPAGWSKGTTAGSKTTCTWEFVAGCNGKSLKFTVATAGTNNWGAGDVRRVVQQEPSPSGIYNYRVRAKRSSGLAAGDLKIDFSAGGGQVTTISASTLTTEWAYYTNTAFTGAVTEPGNCYPVLYFSSSPSPDGEWVAVDTFQIYPAEYPSDDSILYVSEFADPETYLYGSEVSVSENDGQRITDAYELRGILRVAKDRSLYSVVDTGGTADTWKVELASATVGAVGPWAVGVGDGWAILASYDGIYMDVGGIPDKVSQEISNTWADLNRSMAHLTKVTVDTESKRLFVLYPSGTSTTTNSMLVCDYAEGWDDPIKSGGAGRKWSSWTYPLGTMADVGYIRDDNGIPQVMVAGGYGSYGNLMQFDRASQTIPRTAAYRECGFSGKTLTTDTGLSTSTTYYLSVKFNQSPNTVETSITTGGSSPVTFGSLIALLNAAMTGPLAGISWALVAGDLRCTSGALGAGSGITLLVPVNNPKLFPSMTGFTAFETKVAATGAAPSDVLDGTTYAPIDAHYETATIGTPQGRSLFGYIIARTNGAGELDVSLVYSDGTLIEAAGRPLNSNPIHDIEIPIQRTGIQYGARFGTNGVNEWFFTRRVSLFRKPAPFSRVRGHNK